MGKRKKKASAPFTLWKVRVSCFNNSVAGPIFLLVVGPTAGKAERHAIRAAKRDGATRPIAEKIKRLGELRN